MIGTFSVTAELLVNISSPDYQIKVVVSMGRQIP